MMHKNLTEFYNIIYGKLEWGLADYARCLAKVQPIEFPEPLMNGLYPYPPLVLGDDHPISHAEIERHDLNDSFQVLEQCLEPTARIIELAKLKEQLDRSFEMIKSIGISKDSWVEIICKDLERRLTSCENYVQCGTDSLRVFGSEFFGNLLSMRNSIEGLRIVLAERLGHDPYQARFDALDRGLKANKPVEWEWSTSDCEGQLENLAPLQRWWWFEENYVKT